MLSGLDGDFNEFREGVVVRLQRQLDVIVRALIARGFLPPELLELPLEGGSDLLLPASSEGLPAATGGMLPDEILATLTGRMEVMLGEWKQNFDLYVQEHISQLQAAASRPTSSHHGSTSSP